MNFDAPTIAPVVPLQLLTPAVPQNPTFYRTLPISGNLDSSGEATITYEPSIGQAPPGTYSGQTSTAVGSVRIENLKLQ